MHLTATVSRKVRRIYFIFGSVKEPNESLCVSVRLSVCPSGTSLSRALNLHLSLIGQSQVSLRSVLGQSQVSLRFLTGLSELT